MDTLSKSAPACDPGQRLTADVVVIGAGIIGASCAFALARAGLAVHLVERDAPARGTSGACEGNLVLWDRPTSADLHLAMWSHQRWAELAVELPAQTGIDIEYDRKGSLMIVRDEGDVAAAQVKCAWLAAEGVPLEWLDQAGVHAAEPDLAPDIALAVHFPADAQIEPRLATAALVSAARGLGARIHNHEAVLSIESSEAATMVQTVRHRITASWVVVAAGVWTPDVLRMLGVDLQVSARKGQIAIVAGAPIKVHQKVMEASYMTTVANDETELQVAAVVEATRAGSILMGSSRLLTHPNDRRVDLEVVNRIVAKGVSLFPGLASGKVVRSYAGVRPLSPDHSPIIGPLPMAPRVVLATGHEGGGVMMGAATGDLVACLIAGRAAPVPFEPYLPSRFFSH